MISLTMLGTPVVCKSLSGGLQTSNYMNEDAFVGPKARIEQVFFPMPVKVLIAGDLVGWEDWITHGFCRAGPRSNQLA